MRQLKIVKSITNRESASFEKYLQDIGKEPLISSQEEILLAQRIREGDLDALNKLVSANLRFVVSVAKVYQNQGLSLPDLINEGNIGLIKAAKLFDETRGFKFISYAVWWIRQTIALALAEQARTVKLPLNQLGQLNKVNKFSNNFEQANQRSPSAEEISTALEIPVEKVRAILNLSYRDKISIDKPTIPGEDATLLDILESDENTIEATIASDSLIQEVDRSLKILSPKEAEVIIMFFGLKDQSPMTLDEIGEKVDLTRERVRQIKEKALKRIKSNQRILRLLKQYTY